MARGQRRRGDEYSDRRVATGAGDAGINAGILGVTVTPLPRAASRSSLLPSGRSDTLDYPPPGTMRYPLPGQIRRVHSNEASEHFRQ